MKSESTIETKRKYQNYISSIRPCFVENQATEELSIGRGVRQGCVLSPLLFNAYSEQQFKEAVINVEDGFEIIGKIINNVRYAGDTFLIADIAKGLGKNPVHDYHFTANNITLSMTETIRYLGCNLNMDLDHSREM